MRVLRAADYRRMPWKNGGGETREIAVFPAEAGLDDFDWRVSMARVGSSGPFSLFAGVDRTLTILDGEGLILSVEGRIPFGLTGHSEPLPFPADLATTATLIAGPVTDLNVMTRRGRRKHRVTRFRCEGSREISLDAAETLLFCHLGAVRASADGGQVLLGPLDTLILDNVTPIASIEVDSPADLFLIEFFGAS